MNDNLAVRLEDKKQRAKGQKQQISKSKLKYKKKTVPLQNQNKVPQDPKLFDDYQTGYSSDSTLKNNHSNKQCLPSPRLYNPQQNSNWKKQLKEIHVKIQCQKKTPKIDYRKRYEQLYNICQRLEVKPNPHKNNAKGEYKKIITICRNGLRNKKMDKSASSIKKSKKPAKSASKLPKNDYDQRLFELLKCDEEIELAKVIHCQKKIKVDDIHQARYQATKSCRSFHFDLDLPQIQENIDGQGQKTQQVSRQNSHEKPYLTQRLSSSNRLKIKRSNDRKNAYYASNKSKAIPTTNTKNKSSGIRQNESEVNQFLDESISPFSCQLLYDSSKLAQLSTTYQTGLSKIQIEKEGSSSKKIDVMSLIGKERRVKSSMNTYKEKDVRLNKKRRDILGELVENRLKRRQI